jgi:hypothetical protein
MTLFKIKVLFLATASLLALFDYIVCNGGDPG